MNRPDEHPSQDLLRQFAAGNLEEQALAKVAEHLEHCESCSDALDQGVDEKLLNELRDFGSLHHDETS
ncbi:MAG: zf-HC2 domain-containing protein, partial [Planctomycetota bacterium]